MKTTYKEGCYYTLPVKEVITENRKSYYQVTAEDKEYAIPIFDFQKEDEKPDSISCYVKEVSNDTPIFIQDTRPLIVRFYKEGVTYPFWVKTDYSHAPNPYYEISDYRNFNFKVYISKNEQLKVRQRIECRVVSVNEEGIVLQLAKQSENNFLPLLRPEELCQTIEIDPRLAQCVCNAFKKSKLFKNSRESLNNSNEVWIMQAIEELDKSLIAWVKPKKRTYHNLLEAFRKLCFFLLEDSDLLTYCSEQERKSYQDMLSRTIQRCDLFGEALSLVERNEHEQQVENILTKMQKSGFLYEPGKRLQVMMYIFMLDEGVMENKMQEVFTTILKGNKENWNTEPFRSAFIHMLDLYVEHNRYKVDRMANISSDENRNDLYKLLNALAILLLLVTEKDDYDRQLRRSMFYRYLTFLKAGKREVLLEKAFRCITEAEQTRLEYSWKDVCGDLTMLAIRTSSETKQIAVDNSTMMQTYNGNFSRLQIMNGKVELHPLLNSKKKEFPVLPEQLLPWHHIQVYLSGDIKHLGKDEKDLLAYQRFWKDIEHNVFSPSEEILPQPRSRKHRPQTNDLVTIRLSRQDAEDPSYYRFKIEDPVYEGTGQLTMHNIIRYNLYEDESPFRDEMGCPLKFKAKVISVDSETGQLNFSMIDQVNEFIRDNVQVEDEVDCLVTDLSPNRILCVSELGYPIQLHPTEDTEHLTVGDFIRARVSHVRSNYTIEGEYLGAASEQFKLNVAFEDLMYSYSDGPVLETEEVEEEKEIVQPEVMMDSIYLKELIYIIDRKAVLDDNYVNTYNYLAFNRLLTILAKEKDLASYYSECMAFIQLLQHFAINGSVDQERLLNLSSNSGINIANYPLLQSKLDELKMISCMDYPERNNEVWKLIQHTTDDHLFNLGRLVLSYNLLKGFGLHEERKSVHLRITEELNIHMDMEEAVYFGNEDQHTEFKTSIVYPANNGMRPDLKAQTFEIMKVLAGFLNAEGGTLYLGVNNEGVASGLDSDLKFFGDKDRFDLHVRNNIVYALGTDVNARIHTSWPEAKNKVVYAIHIVPYPKPVKLEENYFQRQGTSTWPLLGDDLDAFLERREKEVAKWNQLQEAAELSLKENVPAVEPVPANIDSAPEPGQFTITKESSLIKTSLVRPNPVESWQDNYDEEKLCFLHFLPGSEYMVTPEGIYDETDLTLKIREDEEYVVIVYEDGALLRVPVSSIADKKERQIYSRNPSKVIFACPAKKSDLLIMGTYDDAGTVRYRVDDVEHIKEGKITDNGEPLFVSGHSGVYQCDLLPKELSTPLRRIYNLRNTNPGSIINTTTRGNTERAAIEKYLGDKFIQ